MNKLLHIFKTSLIEIKATAKMQGSNDKQRQASVN